MFTGHATFGGWDKYKCFFPGVYDNMRPDNFSFYKHVTMVTVLYYIASCYHGNNAIWTRSLKFEDIGK